MKRMIAALALIALAGCSRVKPAHDYKAEYEALEKEQETLQERYQSLLKEKDGSETSVTELEFSDMKFALLAPLDERCLFRNDPREAYGLARVKGYYIRGIREIGEGDTEDYDGFVIQSGTENFVEILDGSNADAPYPFAMDGLTDAEIRKIKFSSESDPVELSVYVIHPQDRSMVSAYYALFKALAVRS
jgi:hypothetical protein